MKKQLFALVFLLVTISNFGYSQANCATAVPVTIGTQQCGSSLGQPGDFPNSGASNNPCSDQYNNFDSLDEYWFKITGDGIHALQLFFSGVSPSSIVAIFDDCPGNSPGCVSFNTSSITTSVSLLTPYPLVAGVDYYIMITSANAPGWTSFCMDATLTIPPPPPSNDACNNPTSVPVNSGSSCTPTASGTTMSATQSLPDCIGIANNDIWFSFVATSPFHSFEFPNRVAVAGLNTLLVLELFSGNCSVLTSLGCNSLFEYDDISYNGFVIGTTYYIRVYSFGTHSSQTFDVCIGIPPQPPSNDRCIDATSLTVDSTYPCVSPVAGVTTNATFSMPACIGTSGDDVWYSFVAISSGVIVKVNRGAAIFSQPVHEIFSGVCGSLISLGCTTDNHTMLTGLSIGETYYIRVYNYNTQIADFDICVSVLPPPPANDECQTAELLPVQAGSCSTYTVGDVTTATDSPISAPSCGVFMGKDLWYEVLVPSSGNITFNASTTVLSAVCGALYSGGSCGVLVEEGCTTFPPGAPFEFIGLTPGTYYLRVWEYNNNQIGTYELCAFEPQSCMITGITATAQSACNPANGAYTQQISIVHNAIGATLNVNGQSHSLYANPQTIVLTSLFSDGLPVTVEAQISGSAVCSFVVPDLFTAPAPCYQLPTSKCGSYSSTQIKPVIDTVTLIDTITVSGTNSILNKLNLAIKIDHTYLGDLTVFLISPSGTIVPMILEKCGNSQNMEIEFDDNGSTVTCGLPTIGVFKPAGTLASFIGQPFDGHWQLSVTDNALQDQGELIKWCLLPDLLLHSSELSSKNEVVLAPNPITNQLTISSDLAIDQLEIWSIDGRKVVDQVVEGDQQLVQLDLVYLTAGSYLLRLKSKEHVETKRFVKL